MSINLDLEKEVEAVLHTKTVDQAKRLMQGHSGLAVVSVVSVAESALPLPIVTDPFMIAAIMVDRANTFRLIVAVTLTSVLGGVIAYYTMYFALDFLTSYLNPVLLAQFQSLMASNTANSTFLITILGALTPVPYTLSAWVVGALKGNVWVFIIGSLIGRGVRYAIVGYATYYLGPVALEYAKRYTLLVSVVLVVGAILFLWLKM